MPFSGFGARALACSHLEGLVSSLTAEEKQLTSSFLTLKGSRLWSKGPFLSSHHHREETGLTGNHEGGTCGNSGAATVIRMLTFKVWNSCADLSTSRMFWGDWFCDRSQIASEIKTKFQYPQAREKEGSCAFRWIFNNMFKHCTSSPLPYIFPCQLSGCQLQNFLPWKKVKTSTEVCKTGCDFPKTSDWSPGS